MGPGKLLEISTLRSSLWGLGREPIAQIWCWLMMKWVCTGGRGGGGIWVMGGEWKQH